MDLFSAAEIDFVATIQSDSKNSDRKSQFNDNLNTISNEIWLRVDLIALAYCESN